MKRKGFCKNIYSLLSGSVIFFLVIGVLAACDAPNNGGCGNGGSEIDPPPSEVAGTKTMVPHSSWDCGMPEGIPAPEDGEFVFEVTFNLGEVHDLGQTQYGRRHLIEINGGRVSGSRINATVEDGGLDFQLTLSNGAMEIDQVNILRTSDREAIYFRNCGVSADDNDVRIVPDFEASNSGSYSWLNRGKFVGTRHLDVSNKTMTMKVYDVSGVAINPNAPDAIRVTQPRDLPDQSWECRVASRNERQGDVLYTETVNIGSSISVGDSKYGRRNIIPITGGTARGDIAGRVLAGGADYQLISSGLDLDARYTIETNDGELIIVRNCGPASSLVPTFETRADGKYSYLNDSLWLSSSPGIGIGSVRLTIYESR